MQKQSMFTPVWLHTVNFLVLPFIRHLRLPRHEKMVGILKTLDLIKCPCAWGLRPINQINFPFKNRWKLLKPWLRKEHLPPNPGSVQITYVRLVALSTYVLNADIDPSVTYAGRYIATCPLFSPATPASRRQRSFPGPTMYACHLTKSQEP